jgi:hypothetical protein
MRKLFSLLPLAGEGAAQRRMMAITQTYIVYYLPNYFARSFANADKVSW